MSSDTIGFGGLISAMQTDFGLIETGGDQTLAYLLYNGRLGIFPDPLNATAAMTIGALDPKDYQGVINWVPLVSPPTDGSWKFENIFGIDGLKGYNGSFLPDSENTLATMDSVFIGVSMPNVNTYLKDTNYSGPVTYKTISDGIISYPCNGNSIPYVALTATINGVDYPIDSEGNLLRTLSPMAPQGYCSVGITNKTSSPPYMLNLGLPFLRSVYLAFRFPSDNCPGYYGFAFPSGPINRTASQISQMPTSTPTNSAQCLAFSTPTATPLLSLASGTPQQMQMWSQGYKVYGDPGQAPVDLFGVEGLLPIVWNGTNWR
ncbi:hypothetical protein F5I97DRAFT_1937717 [Phlebopus sp. FC_14]|nr:hypothetical protein F5I97DRAFT_1937717 [Phlebopus sp. FC_14]